MELRRSRNTARPVFIPSRSSACWRTRWAWRRRVRRCPPPSSSLASIRARWRQRQSVSTRARSSGARAERGRHNTGRGSPSLSAFEALAPKLGERRERRIPAAAKPRRGGLSARRRRNARRARARRGGARLFDSERCRARACCSLRRRVVRACARVPSVRVRWQSDGQSAAYVRSRACAAVFSHRSERQRGLSA